MQSGLIVALVVLLMPTLAFADGRAASNAEGEIYDFRAGETYAWSPPPETYLLVVTSDEEGARIDMSDMDAGDPEAGAKPYGPGRASSMTAVEFEHGATRGLRILEGSGRLTLARMDFARGLPIEGPIDQLDAQGFLDGGACRSYGFSKLRMDKPYLVAANGTGLTFALFDWYIETRKTQSGSLVATLDPNRSDEKGFVLQACNPTGERLAYAARITYPAPTNNPNQAPALSVALMAVAVLLATIAVNRRRP